MHQSTSAVRSMWAPGILQLALVITAFAALRLVQSPSTMTFFIFEAAVAATAGIYLYERSARARGQPPAPARPAMRDASWTPAADIRTAPAAGATGASLPVLVSEARELLSEARSVGVDCRAQERMIRRAHRESELGRVDVAARTLRNANERLRARIDHRVRASSALGRVTASRPAFLALSTAFFLLISLSLWALSTGLYVAPLSFYLLVALATGVLVANALISGENRSVSVLLQIIVLGALLKFHFFYLNPYLYTSDAFFHFGSLQAVANTGYVPLDRDHYTYFPSFYVLGFVGISVAGLPSEWYGIFAFLAQLVTIPLAYCYGRAIANQRVGLLAAVLMAFSVFFFLSAQYNPSLYGLVFILLALYAAVRMQGDNWTKWFVVFWVAALGAFFSHPISGLVLAITLLIRYAVFSATKQEAGETRLVRAPALSFGVAYGAYLVLIAVVSFRLFVAAVFAPTYTPPLATTPTETLQATSSYPLESALAPLGVAVLFLFAAFGLKRTPVISRQEHRFLVLLTGIFVLFPAIEFVAGNFSTQAARFLIYLTIPLVLLGGLGASEMAHAGAPRPARPIGTIEDASQESGEPPPPSRRAGAVLIGLFMVLAFAGASTYLTTNDFRELYQTIPALTTHITESAVAGRNFVALAGSDNTVYMDLGSLLYFNGNEERARNSLTMQTYQLNHFVDATQGSFVLLNRPFLAYGDAFAGGFYDVEAIELDLLYSNAHRLFDAGQVQVFYAP